MYNLTLDPAPGPHEVDWQASTLLLPITRAELTSSASGQVGHERESKEAGGPAPRSALYFRSRAGDLSPTGMLHQTLLCGREWTGLLPEQTHVLPCSETGPMPRENHTGCTGGSFVSEGRKVITLLQTLQEQLFLPHELLILPMTPDCCL